jgi:hypothetical protein
MCACVDGCTRAEKKNDRKWVKIDEEDNDDIGEDDADGEFD